MILQVPRLAPHVLRHLAALARLGAQDAKLAAKVYGRYALGLAIAGVAAVLALLMACAWILAATWDTPYRTWAAGGLTVLFAFVALAMLWSARARVARSATFDATRRNVELDRRLYAELRPESAQAAATPPELQLQRSRDEIRRVAEPAHPAKPARRFPRSRTMQVLTRSGPAGSAALLALLMQRRHRRHGVRHDPSPWTS
jgi:uncharacterized membrane protein YqjE